MTAAVWAGDKLHLSDRLPDSLLQCIKTVRDIFLQLLQLRKLLADDRKFFAE